MLVVTVLAPSNDDLSSNIGPAVPGVPHRIQFEAIEDGRRPNVDYRS